jgi:hypothetical protein
MKEVRNTDPYPEFLAELKKLIAIVRKIDIIKRKMR